MDNPDDYSTPPPRLTGRLARLRTVFIAALVVIFIAPFPMGAIILEFGLSTRFVLAAIALVGVAATTCYMIAASLSPDDRATMMASNRKVLGPLPAVAAARTFDLALSRRAARKYPDAADGRLTMDIGGLTVPLAALKRPPASIRRSVPSQVTLAWSDIAEWRVCSDSDGADTYEIETHAPWYRTEKSRWSPLLINRSVIIDEIELLDAVRSVGQLAVVLKSPVSNKH